jgi:diguanylate cyclase (GGDEF)-like protein
MRRCKGFLRVALSGDLLGQFGRVPPAVAWKLLGLMFGPVRPILIGGGVFVLLGVVGFVGTGSAWYLAGSAAMLLVAASRIVQSVQFRRNPQRHPLRAWAWRAVVSAWCAGAIWGCWNLAILFEPDRDLALMIVGVQAGILTAAAMRNSALPAQVIGQVLLASVPLLVASLFSSSRYINVFAIFAALQIAGALSAGKEQHRLILRLLEADEEKSRLLRRLAGANEELELLNNHLRTLADTDPLTEVANRRMFDLSLAREWRRSAREQSPLALLMVDIDAFKAFNDFYGHPAGDICLRSVAAVMAAAARRPGDLAARYGGEEFAIILPGTEIEGARHVAEKIRAGLAARALSHEASEHGLVTVSIGAASLIAQPGGDPEMLIALADAALYTAKHSGRDCVRLAPIAGILPLATVLADLSPVDAISTCPYTSL